MLPVTKATRLRQISRLGSRGDLSVLPELVAALNEDDPDLRQAAARALGRLGSPEGVVFLMERIRDDSRDVRLRVVQALGWIGSDSGVEGLKIALEDNDVSVRLSAVMAMGWIGSEATITSIIEALYDEDRTVRQVASGVLVQFQGAVVPYLIEMLAGDGEQVNWASYSLTRIAGPAVPSLLQLMVEGDDTLAQRAHDILVESGQAVVSNLLSVLRSDHQPEAFRQAACEVLAGIGGEQVAIKLQADLESDDPVVAELAASVLDRIGMVPLPGPSEPEDQDGVPLAERVLQAPRYPALSILKGDKGHIDQQTHVATIWLRRDEDGAAVGYVIEGNGRRIECAPDDEALIGALKALAEAAHLDDESHTVL